MATATPRPRRETARPANQQAGPARAAAAKKIGGYWTSPWQNGEYWYPVMGGHCVACAGVVSHMLDAPTGMVGAVAGAGALGVAIAVNTWRDQGMKLSPTAKLFFTAAVTTAAGWLAYVTEFGPWSWEAAAWLYGPVLFATPLWRMARKSVVKKSASTTAKLKSAIVGEEKAAWEALFTGVGLKGLEFVSSTKTPAGYSIEVRTPVNKPWTATTLDKAMRQVENAMGQREGAIRVSRIPDASGSGYLAGRFALLVDEKDILAEEIRLPEEYHALSVNDEFCLGQYETREPVMVRLREIAAMLIGLRGAGKSNTLNVIMSYLVRCVDALVWMIDITKKGRTAHPWNKAWYEGKAAKPAIDWVATDHEEADVLLQCGESLIMFRAASSAGGNKIIPGAVELGGTGHCALFIIVEEAGSNLGNAAGGGRRSRAAGGPINQDLRQRVTNVTITGRSEAVDPILVSQSAKVDMIGGGVLKGQIDLRIGHGVSTLEEAQSIFQGGGSIAARILTRLGHKGSMVIQTGKKDPLAAKAFFMGDGAELLARIYRIAIAAGPLRPDLSDDEIAGMETAVFDGAYTQRWHRAPLRPAHLTAPPAAAAQTGGGTATMQAPARPADRGGSGRTRDADYERRLREVRERYRGGSSVVPPVGGRKPAPPPTEQPPAPVGPPRYVPPKDVPRTPVDEATYRAARDAMFADLSGLVNLDETVPEPGDATARDAIVGFLRLKQDKGAKFGEVQVALHRAGIKVHKATVHRTLKAMIDEGEVWGVVKGGSYVLTSFADPYPELRDGAA